MFSPGQKGFTLIEIAIVLLIVAIILGYTVAMLPIQQELKQYREVDGQMEEITKHLIGFAQVNGRLPCPDTDSDGLENAVDAINNIDTLGGAAATDGITDSCAGYFGFLPNQTLGISGKVNANGNLIDPWGGAFGYAVSDVDGDRDGDGDTLAGIDLVTPNGVREEGMMNVIPDIYICNNSTATGNHDGCVDSPGDPPLIPVPVAPVTGGNQVAQTVAAVVISLGKDFVQAGASNVQQENFDDFGDGTNDKVYVSAGQSDAANAEFDDVVKWIPYTLLYSKMIDADQLP